MGRSFGNIHHIAGTSAVGNYEIVFESVDARKNDTVPISIGPYASSSVQPGTLTGSSSSLSASNSLSSSSTVHPSNNEYV